MVRSIPGRPQLSKHRLRNDHQRGEGYDEGEESERDRLGPDGALDLGGLVTQVGHEDVAAGRRVSLGQRLCLPTELEGRRARAQAHIGPVEASVRRAELGVEGLRGVARPGVAPAR